MADTENGSDGVDPMLRLARLAGVFAEGDGGAGADDGDPREDGNGDDAKPADEKPDASIADLVKARNAEQRARAKAEARVKALEASVATLKADDKTASVAELQSKLDEADKALGEIEDYFDALLEAEMAAMADAAKSALTAVPGTAQDRYKFLVAHRSLFGAASGAAPATGGRAPSHEKTPAGGKTGGVSEITKKRIERANARVREAKGWHIPGADR